MVVVSPSFTAPAEGILMQIPAVQLIVNNNVELGTATLYITEHNVVWGGGVGRHGGPGPTVTLRYENISLHAVQRDPGPGLIVVINHELDLPEMKQQALPGKQGNGDATEHNADVVHVDGDDEEFVFDDDDEFEVDEEPMAKLRFVPPNDNQLEAMYLAMNQGQTLHPDPQDAEDIEEEPYMDGEEFDEGEDEFEDAEEEESNMSHEEATARLRLMRLDNVNGQPDRVNDDAGDAGIAE